MHPKLALHAEALVCVLLLAQHMISRPASCQGSSEARDGCKPESCGNLTNISYPFWVDGKQSPSCGLPNFQVTCNDRGVPILSRSFEEHLSILNISYDDGTVTLRDWYHADGNCSNIPPYNNSYGLMALMTVTKENRELYFYDCKQPPCAAAFPIPCPNRSNFAHLGGQWGDPQESPCNSSPCRFNYVPVLGFDNATSKDYMKLLIGGFRMRWRCTSCSECASSTCLCTEQSCNKSHRKEKIAIGVGIGVGGFIISSALCAALYLWNRRRRRRSSSALRSLSAGLPSAQYGTHVFSYKELDEATDGFSASRELGDGGFGTVYKGKLRDGRLVAVKRLYGNNYKRVEQFMNEVGILSGVRHRNLVTLYGCTSRHSRELLLVYEYVPNGTVADHLYGTRRGSGSLTWPVRMGVAIETADALSYLHAVEPQIIHRDVKTNNILLDDGFHVKVADFGLSRMFPANATHVSTAPQGTPGYVDPEYHRCFQLTDKSDVYSFGVVLAELITSKPAVDVTRQLSEINLANMVIEKIERDELSQLVDPALGYETDPEVKLMIDSVAELALRCLQTDRNMRPAIKEVVEVLRDIESGGSRKETRVHYLVADLQVAAEAKEDARLLKTEPPYSPISVTQRWTSVATSSASA